MLHMNALKQLDANKLAPEINELLDNIFIDKVKPKNMMVMQEWLRFAISNFQGSISLAITVDTPKLLLASALKANMQFYMVENDLGNSRSQLDEEES